jgi:hypothetical protein
MGFRISNQNQKKNPDLLFLFLLLPFTRTHNHQTTPTITPPTQSGRRALLVLLRSWAGVTLLASHERKGLKALLHGVLGDGSVDPTVRLALFEVVEAVLRPLVRLGLGFCGCVISLLEGAKGRKGCCVV